MMDRSFRANDAYVSRHGIRGIGGLAGFQVYFSLGQSLSHDLAILTGYALGSNRLQHDYSRLSFPISEKMPPEMARMQLLVAVYIVAQASLPQHLGPDIRISHTLVENIPLCS